MPVVFNTSASMLKFVILLAIIGCALGAVVPKGMLPQLNGRIVNGTPASISSFPWQISLQRNGAHSCGGSIYSREIIVTAAHCLEHAFISVLRVRAGSSFWISGGVLVGVKAFKIHENYNSATYVNDIGVLWMSYSLAFSSTIRPIPLASITPKNGTDAIVSGWGVTVSGSSSFPSQLKSVNVVILSRGQCASSNYKYGSDIKESMICAFHLDSDSCQGDSGGPLVSNGALVGVVSWGYGCALSPYPGVYSDVAALRSWIVHNAN